MSSTLTVNVVIGKKAVPALGVRNIGYVQIVSGLATEDMQIDSTTSISEDGVLLSELNEQERHDLVRLFRSLVLSLENDGVSNEVGLKNWTTS